MEATLKRLCGNPTRIPRKWVCGPGLELGWAGLSRQSLPTPFI